MSELECGTIREQLPLLFAAALSADAAAAVKVHCTTCEECAAEAELVSTLFATRPQAPAGLVASVMGAVRADSARPSTPSRPWWGLAAAAVAALALGIGMDSGSAPRVDVPAFAYETSEDAVWLSDDGLVAGAPSWETLSDETLAELLEDLEPGASPGGAA